MNFSGCDGQIDTGDEFGVYWHLARRPVLWKANCNFSITTSRLWAILPTIFVVRRRTKNTYVSGERQHSRNARQVRNYETVRFFIWVIVSQPLQKPIRRLTLILTSVMKQSHTDKNLWQPSDGDILLMSTRHVEFDLHEVLLEQKDN